MSPPDKYVPAPDPHEPPRARAARIEREHREALQSLAEATERHKRHNDGGPPEGAAVVMSIYDTLADGAADGLADHLEAIGRQGISLEARVALLERVVSEARELLDEYVRACHLANAPKSQVAKRLEVLLVDVEIVRHM